MQILLKMQKLLVALELLVLDYVAQSTCSLTMKR